MATSDLLLDIANQRLDRVLAVGDTQYECGALSAFDASYDHSWGRVKSITSPIPGDEEYVTGPGCGGATASGYFDYFGRPPETRPRATTASTSHPDVHRRRRSAGTWSLSTRTTDARGRPGGKSSAQVGWLRNDLDAHADVHHRHVAHAAVALEHLVVSRPVREQAAPAHLARGGRTRSRHHAPREPALLRALRPQNETGGSSSTGTREFIVGTGGKSTGTPRFAAPNSQFRSNAMGVLKLVLHDGSYNRAFIDRFGTTIDSGTDTCRNPR